MKAVLNSFFFLRKDFTRTKSTKSTKRHKDTRAKVIKMFNDSLHTLSNRARYFKANIYIGTVLINGATKITSSRRQRINSFREQNSK